MTMKIICYAIFLSVGYNEVFQEKKNNITLTDCDPKFIMDSLTATFNIYNRKTLNVQHYCDGTLIFRDMCARENQCSFQQDELARRANCEDFDSVRIRFQCKEGENRYNQSRKTNFEIV